MTPLQSLIDVRAMLADPHCTASELAGAWDRISTEHADEILAAVDAIIARLEAEA